jgi:hypothetical protein
MEGHALHIPNNINLFLSRMLYKPVQTLLYHGLGYLIKKAEQNLYQRIGKSHQFNTNLIKIVLMTLLLAMNVHFVCSKDTYYTIILYLPCPATRCCGSPG